MYTTQAKPTMNNVIGRELNQTEPLSNVTLKLSILLYCSLSNSKKALLATFIGT